MKGIFPRRDCQFTEINQAHSVYINPSYEKKGAWEQQYFTELRWRLLQPLSAAEATQKHKDHAYIV